MTNPYRPEAAGVGGCPGGGRLGSPSGPCHAHVKYVTEGSGHVDGAVAFLVEVFSEPANALLFAVVGLGVVAAVAGYLWRRPAARDVAAARRTLSAYNDLVPWMLRLSVGLPLVGAGFAGYFFSPEVQAWTRLFQVVVGFLLLFGLATRLVAAVALIAYLGRLVLDPTLLLASEFVGGLVGLIVLGSGRPSADQLLRNVAETEGTIYNRIDPVHGPAERFEAAIQPYEDYAATAVRVGLGFNFAYLGLTQKLLAPGQALRVVEKYGLTGVVPVDPGVWVVGTGLTEVALGTALVLGLFTRAAAGVAFLMFTLTLFGLPDDPVLAHVTLFGMASTLLVSGSGPLAVDNRLHGPTEPVEKPTGEPAAGEH